MNRNGFDFPKIPRFNFRAALRRIFRQNKENPRAISRGGFWASKKAWPFSPIGFSLRARVVGAAGVNP